MIFLAGHGHDYSLQGMGMIAASLLLFLKEDDTFWMMACIVQVNDWDDILYSDDDPQSI